MDFQQQLGSALNTLKSTIDTPGSLKSKPLKSLKSTWSTKPTKRLTRPQINFLQSGPKHLVAPLISELKKHRKKKRIPKKMEDSKSGALSSAQTTAAPTLDMATLFMTLQAAATQQLLMLPTYIGLSHKDSTEYLRKCAAYFTARNMLIDKQTVLLPKVFVTKLKNGTNIIDLRELLGYLVTTEYLKNISFTAENKYLLESS